MLCVALEHALVGRDGAVGIVEAVLADARHAEQPEDRLFVVLGAVDGALVELDQGPPLTRLRPEAAQRGERLVMIRVEPDGGSVMAGRGAGRSRCRSYMSPMRWVQLGALLGGDDAALGARFPDADRLVVATSLFVEPRERHRRGPVRRVLLERALVPDLRAVDVVEHLLVEVRHAVREAGLLVRVRDALDERGRAP